MWVWLLHVMCMCKLNTKKVSIYLLISPTILVSKIKRNTIIIYYKHLRCQTKAHYNSYSSYIKNDHYSHLDLHLSLVLPSVVYEQEEPEVLNIEMQIKKINALKMSFGSSYNSTQI